jgi:cytochrome d ubiquinol oxidase subunit I
MAAMLAGWEVTEAGRQPWIVYGRMTVLQAATTSGGIGWSLIATVVVYLGLATALVLILRKLATGAPPELAGGSEGPDPQGPESGAVSGGTDENSSDSDTTAGADLTSASPATEHTPSTSASATDTAQVIAFGPHLEGAPR